MASRVRPEQSPASCIVRYSVHWPSVRCTDAHGSIPTKRTSIWIGYRRVHKRRFEPLFLWPRVFRRCCRKTERKHRSRLCFTVHRPTHFAPTPMTAIGTVTASTNSSTKRGACLAEKIPPPPMTKALNQFTFSRDNSTSHEH